MEEPFALVFLFYPLASLPLDVDKIDRQKNNFNKFTNFLSFLFLIFLGYTSKIKNHILYNIGIIFETNYC